MERCAAVAAQRAEKLIPSGKLRPSGNTGNVIICKCVLHLSYIDRTGEKPVKLMSGGSRPPLAFIERRAFVHMERRFMRDRFFISGR